MDYSKSKCNDLETAYVQMIDDDKYIISPINDFSEGFSINCMVVKLEN